MGAIFLQVKSSKVMIPGVAVWEGKICSAFKVVGVSWEQPKAIIKKEIATKKPKTDLFTTFLQVKLNPNFCAQKEDDMISQTHLDEKKDSGQIQTVVVIHPRNHTPPNTSPKCYRGGGGFRILQSPTSSYIDADEAGLQPKLTEIS